MTHPQIVYNDIIMSWRIQKRTNIFGGLGLNWSKSGVSPSLRTVFGSIGPKGGSIRTGIPGLFYRWHNSKKRDAQQHFKSEFKTTEEKARTWLKLADRINEYMQMDADYPSEIHHYRGLIATMKEFIELGSEVDDELEALQNFSRDNNLGMIRILDNIRNPLDTEMEKVIGSLEQTLKNIAKYNAEHGIRNEFSGDLISSLKSSVIEDIRIEMTCDSCEQNISLNQEAIGQEFNCPTCNASLKL